MKFGKMLDTINGKTYLLGIREDGVIVKWTNDGVYYDYYVTVNAQDEKIHICNQVAIGKDNVNKKWDVKDISLDLIEEIMNEN